MIKTERFKIPQKYIVLSMWLSIAISILVHFSSFLDEFFQVQNQNLSIQKYFLNSSVELFITFFIAVILFNLNYYFLQPQNFTKKIKPIRLIFALLISLLVVNVLSDLLFQLKRQFPLQQLSHGTQNIYFLRDIFITIVIIISILITKVIFQNQNHRLEIQQLKIENLNRQFEALKNQLSPHFLFNSLTALKTLISDSPKDAEQYVKHLSGVLRYTLQANENKLVTLFEEVQFIQSYFFLVKLRYNQNIFLTNNIDEKFLQWKLPPLAIQILIENAIRHNEISTKKMLEISIISKNDCIVISNTINPKITPEPGTGIGLVNLSNQYKLLAGKEIYITTGNNHFNVEIPLLEL